MEDITVVKQPLLLVGKLAALGALMKRLAQQHLGTLHGQMYVHC